MRKDRRRAEEFAKRLGLKIPILMAPMAGACPPALASAVASAGGMGACGAVLLGPPEIASWAERFRQASNGAFQINLWVPDPPPRRDPNHEDRLRAFLAEWGPPPPNDMEPVGPPDFGAQCRAMIDASPAAVSSIMGVFPEPVVAELKQRGIVWFATATTLSEALTAQAAGADVVVAQGMEAGGHRGAFDPAMAGKALIGTFALLPAIVDAVEVPVVAAGGIGDARHVAAALALGASAVQVGTALLRSPEAAIPSAWADGIEKAAPEDTMLTRAFSGRLGRALATGYVRAATDQDTPEPAPYPVQRALTQPMRTVAAQQNRLEIMQAWAGQSAGLAAAKPAADIVNGLWDDTLARLG